MTEFLSALAVFLAAHLLPALPRARAMLVARFGQSVYLAGYSVVSLLLLGWVIVAAGRAEVVTLWGPAAWQWIVPFIVMPLALFLLVAGLAEPNPLSIHWRRGDAPGAVVTITRHPVLWAFLLWALAHLPANGRLVPVILFTAMALFSVLGFVQLDRKARRRLGEERWRRLADRTSILPFAALLAGRARVSVTPPLVAATLVAAGLYVWFLWQGHALLVGPDPWAGLRSFF